MLICVIGSEFLHASTDKFPTNAVITLGLQQTCKNPDLVKAINNGAVALTCLRNVFLYGQ